MAAGATVTVQFVPLPLSTRLLLGIRVVLAEAAETVRLPLVVPLWPTVNANGPQLVLAVMV